MLAAAEKVCQEAGEVSALGFVAATWAVSSSLAYYYPRFDERNSYMRCIRCGSMHRRRDGHTRLGGQRWRCTACRRRFTARSSSAFSGHDFADEIVTLAVRWYVRYRLSYADVSELLAGRGVMVSRSTVYRWVQRFLPLFAEAARAYCQPTGGKWRVDETYCRLDGR